MSFAPLFDRFALSSAERQEQAQDVVGGRPFTAELSRGVVGFEPALEVRAELVGTEADNPGSWMWSWANPSGFADEVTAAVWHARSYGEQEGIGELTTGEIPLDGITLGYRLTVVACGLAGGYAYYPATAAPGTTAYMLLDHPSLALPPVQLSRSLSALTAVSASAQVADWRFALISYAGQRGLEVRPAERWVELVHPGGQGSIRVELDERGRVVNIAGRLQPIESKRPKRRLFGLGTY